MRHSVGNDEYRPGRRINAALAAYFQPVALGVPNWHRAGYLPVRHLRIPDILPSVTQR